MREGAIETQLGRGGSFGTAARNGTLHRGAIAVVVAAGAPLECIKVGGTERQLRKELLEFIAGKCPGVSKTSAKQFADTQIEYCRLKGVKLDGCSRHCGMPGAEEEPFFRPSVSSS